MPYVVVPWILHELAGLSLALCVGLLAIGLLLLVLGGYGHRFWLVLGMTLAAGIVGLQYGPQFGMQPLVAGLFVGLSAGALALALMRIAIFIAVGALAAYLASTLAPGWDEQLACFLVGGLIGVLLFRFWVMVLTSLLGTLLVTYASLLLIHRFGNADVVGLATRNGPLFNWAILGVTLLGLVFQTLLFRSSGASDKGGDDKGKKDKEKDKDREKKKEREKKRAEPEEVEEAVEPRRWWFPIPFFGKKAS